MSPLFILTLFACNETTETGIVEPTAHEARFAPGEMVTACPGDTWTASVCWDYQGQRWCQPLQADLFTVNGCLVTSQGEDYTDGTGREVIVRWP